MNKIGIKSLEFLAVALALSLSVTASAQREGGHGGGGWGGSHGGGYGGGSRGTGGGGFSHESSSGSRFSSRSGVTHNVYHEAPGNRVTIDGMPHAGHYDPHGWQWNHHDLIHDGFRWGYYHYDRWWRDDSFLFGFYVFDPIGAWVYSPWYYYPCLPPYIAEDHVIVESNEPQNWSDGGSDFTEYQWLTPDKNSTDATDLDYALQDLTAAFLDRNSDAISRLCPRAGRVAIYTDGHYSYSLSADNFYDTFKDGAAGPRTTRYKILDVKTNGHDIANVEAEQDYTDPWGKEAVVYHTFRMVQEGPNVVIRSFGTYKNRPW